MTAAKTPIRATRLNLNLSGNAREELDHIAEIANCTLTQLVHFGLILVKYYYELPAGERLAVVKDGKAIRDIVPPWYLSGPIPTQDS